EPAELAEPERRLVPAGLELQHAALHVRVPCRLAGTLRQALDGTTQQLVRRTDRVQRLALLGLRLCARVRRGCRRRGRRGRGSGLRRRHALLAIAARPLLALAITRTLAAPAALVATPPPRALLAP